MKVIFNGRSEEANEMNISHLVQIHFLHYTNDAYADDTTVFECRNYDDLCMVTDLSSHLDLINH